MKTSRTTLVLALVWGLNVLAPVLHWAQDALHHDDAAHEAVADCGECESLPAGSLLERACGDGPCDDPHHHHHSHSDHQHSTRCPVCSSMFARLATMDVEFVLPPLQTTVVAATEINPETPGVRVHTASARGPPQAAIPA